MERLFEKKVSHPLCHVAAVVLLDVLTKTYIRLAHVPSSTQLFNRNLRSSWSDGYHLLTFGRLPAGVRRRL